MKFFVATPRLFTLAVSGFAVGCLFMTTGCGGSKATAANNIAPQSLSEPVRASESGPSSPPSIPVSSNSDEYAVQKTGQSRELPTFIPPNSSAAHPAAASAAVPAPASATSSKVSGNGKVHTLAKGETLYALSRQYNIKVKDIVAANNFKDPSKLSVGTKVNIPN